jgi:enamine deaminase RidA (YjgF/YER057c/UK114 family)
MTTSRLLHNSPIISFVVFTSNFPARTCFQAGKLPLGASVEIEVIAVVGNCKIEVVKDE